MSPELPQSFTQLSLSPPVIKALEAVGYETPSPIQAQIIPLVVDGRDVLGQAQTGTGKTAAFALPVLSRLNLSRKQPQVLVLTPTRELAIQVAEAFQKYAQQLSGFHVLPVYGGQEYRGQIRALKRGVHVVVGTPGRVIDHMRRGTLKLEGLSTLVLDEADEMLRMGFIDDVEWILEQTPPERQVALFSATMPKQIRRIAGKYLNNPAQVTIKASTGTAATIRQRLWMVRKIHKLEALTRILEAEPIEAAIVFVRTKTATTELADKLQARGYAAEALNGDIAQQQRERIVGQLKSGKLDILVATDVAARGLDVERVSHVVNYDIPYDTEAYVHRIGRTGRAGRKGDAILFVAPRERRLLGAIEKATGQKIELMNLPTAQEVEQQRIERFKQRISHTLENVDLDFLSGVVDDFATEQALPLPRVAAALAFMAQGDAPLLPVSEAKQAQLNGRQRGLDEGGKRAEKRRGHRPDTGMERFRLEVGSLHKVNPGQIVGAIANEAGIEGKLIGAIDIHTDHTLIDLPRGMPRDIYQSLKNTRVAGRRLNIRRQAQTRGKARAKAAGRKGRPASRSRPGTGKPRATGSAKNRAGK